MTFQVSNAQIMACDFRSTGNISLPCAPGFAFTIVLGRKLIKSNKKRKNTFSGLKCALAMKGFYHLTYLYGEVRVLGTLT